MFDVSPTAPRSLVIRRACGTLAILVLFLQSAGGGHMLLVEHTKCAEHGDLVHSAHGHSVNLAPNADRSLRSPFNTEDEASHEHCSLATERRDAVTPIVDAWVIGTLTIDAPDRFGAAVAPSEIAPRFRLAPKNSPPA